MLLVAQAPRVTALIAALGLASAGCLARTYQIPKAELMRLAATAPELRGQQVRVTQELGTADEAPESQPVSDGTMIVLVPDVEVGGGRPHPIAPHPRPQGVGGAGSTVATDGKAANAKETAVLFIVLAVTAVVILAATEGARYDGWVQLHPMYPLHLQGPDGYVDIPLAQLDPATAAWADRAVVRVGEGPWRELGRAPLDRAGLTYAVLGGSSTVVSGDGSRQLGATTHLQLGYFPQHTVGVLFDIGLAWRPNRFDYTAFSSRWGLELDVLPLDAGPLHAGVFASAALDKRIEDGVVSGHNQSWSTTAGGVIQLSLSTRLALTGRLGVGKAYGDTTRDFTLGLSVY